MDRKETFMKPTTRRKRLRKLADQIVKHEKQFSMGTWFQMDGSDLPERETVKKIIEKRRPICGTSGCAAGWAVILFGTKKQIKACIKEEADWSEEAQKLLGMTSDEANIFHQVNDVAQGIAEDLREMAKEGPL
jgi:hypothetical protein